MFGKKLSIKSCTAAWLALLFIGCSTYADERLPYYNTPDFTPHWLTDTKIISETITHKIASFSFTNQDNNLITQQAVAGKIYVANFFFTSCPSICPKMTSEYEKIQNEFKDNPAVMLLSFSVTPWIDSVARLKEFADDHAIIKDKWHLLTGNKSEIYELARTSYFAEEDQGFTRDSTEFLHTENFILVDKNSRIRGIYKGTISLDTKRLIEDIKVLLKED